MIKVAAMKIQSRVLLAGVLAIASLAAFAQDKPAAPAKSAAAPASKPAASPAAKPDPEARIVGQAEALTEEQINQSHDIAALSRVAQLYESQGDMQRFAWTLKRLIALLPDSGQLRLQLAMVYAAQNDKARAYDVLVHMQSSGFGYDISQDTRFNNIHGTKVWDYIVANLQVNAKQFGEGKLAFELPKGDYLFESIGYDPARKQFLVGSAREGKVYLADMKGKLTDFIRPTEENGMYAVLDLAVDAAHDKLYVASAGVPYFTAFKASAFGQTSLIEYRLSTGKFLNRYDLAQDGKSRLLTSITVGKDGHVFAADGDRGQIFRLVDNELKLLAGNPTLSSIRGLAASDDGTKLYFADYAMGIFGIDLTKSTPFALAHNPDKLVLGGIVGIYFYDGRLVVIESGMVPQRVMRLKLSDDGRSVASAMPLDVAQPAFSVPTVGAVVGDQLYFIANSQKALYDKFGTVRDPSALEPVRIFKSNLRFAWDQSGIAGGMSELPKQKAPDAKAPPEHNPPAKSGDGSH